MRLYYAMRTISTQEAHEELKIGIRGFSGALVTIPGSIFNGDPLMRLYCAMRTISTQEARGEPKIGTRGIRGR